MENFQETKKESTVEDYLKKLENMGAYQAVYLNVCRLDDRSRSAQNKKAMQECFDQILKEETAKLFVLPNDDMALVFDKSLRDEVSPVLVKLKFLMQDTPKVEMSATLEDAGIALWYNLMLEYGDFVKKVSAAYEVQEKQQPQETPSFFNTSPKRASQKLTTEMLAKVQKIISVSDFSSFVRRQAVCAIIGKSAPQRIFEEVFVSIPDLRDSLLPDVDITHNPWLFLALTETLDKRVLELISRHDDGSLSGNFSFNVNVSTILSDDFLHFDDSISGAMRQTIILELQLTDIFSDIRSFILAKTFAKARGYKICIDGITYDKLQYLNRAGLDCDLMKIVWHPELVHIFNEDKHFMDYMNKAERAKIILCRIDEEKAISAGNQLGINLYQGRYVQSLLSAQSSKR